MLVFVTGPASSRRNLASVERAPFGPPPKPIQQHKPRDVAERTEVVGIRNWVLGEGTGDRFSPLVQVGSNEQRRNGISDHETSPPDALGALSRSTQRRDACVLDPQCIDLTVVETSDSTL